MWFHRPGPHQAQRQAPTRDFPTTIANAPTINQPILQETTQPENDVMAPQSPANRTLRQNEVICQHFQILEKLGSGGRGTVYLVQSHDGRKFAAKLEGGINKRTHKNEVEVFQALTMNAGTPDGFPNSYFVGIHRSYSVLVMDLLGDNFYTISRCRSFTSLTALKFSIEALKRLETLHQHGFIHGDVKPHNFTISTKGIVYLIDFGMTTRYRDPKTNQHLSKTQLDRFHGTIHYASLNAQRSCSQSRRDDLESLGYSVIDMIKGRLPWDLDSDDSNDTLSEDVAVEKESISLSELCDGLPKAVYQYMTEVTCLSYTETPDYDRLRELFIDEIKALELPQARRQ